MYLNFPVFLNTEFINKKQGMTDRRSFDRDRRSLIEKRSQGDHDRDI